MTGAIMYFVTLHLSTIPPECASYLIIYFVFLFCERHLSTTFTNSRYSGWLKFYAALSLNLCCSSSVN
jgi:hypothetical protein